MQGLGKVACYARGVLVNLICCGLAVGVGARPGVQRGEPSVPAGGLWGRGDRTTPSNSTPGRVKPSDTILTFLNNL
jgi:hypothetical protein